MHPIKLSVGGVALILVTAGSCGATGTGKDHAPAHLSGRVVGKYSPRVGPDNCWSLSVMGPDRKPWPVCVDQATWDRAKTGDTFRR